MDFAPFHEALKDLGLKILNVDPSTKCEIFEIEKQKNFDPLKQAMVTEMKKQGFSVRSHNFNMSGFDLVGTRPDPRPLVCVVVCCPSSDDKPDIYDLQISYP